jgi:hypothetical protein
MNETVRDMEFRTSNFSFQPANNASIVEPSLRANGSRECAPDDRLREAIHFSFARRDGLLRCARNDVELETRIRIPRRDAPEALHESLAL